MWHNRSLRTRILLGYGLILGLASALALFLVLRVDALNQNMQQLNNSVASETDIGVHMTADVLGAQYAVGRYLQQPQPEHLEGVYEALRQLTANIEQNQAVLSNSTQEALLVRDLKHQIQAYHSTFESVSRLIKEQEPIRSDLNQHLLRTASLLTNAVAQAHRSAASQEQVAQFTEAQASIQQAGLWIVRLGNGSTEGFGINAVAELNKASLILKRTVGDPGSAASTSIDSTLAEIALATDLTNELIENIRAVQRQRDGSLAKQEDSLKQQADAIAQRAVGNLTGTAGDLARQTLQVQQIAGGALLLAFVCVLVLGVGLANTITRPLKELVLATTRLTQGDYDVTVSQSDGGEIGQLATIFNQMTATLKQQRTEVLQQQAAILSRNRELEHALAEIQAATEARAALAATVRALTVPVVPILDNVLVVSLVGEIDEQRARTLLDSLLGGITTHQARIAILDVTGVPFVDPAIVQWLINVMHGATLLGARCLLVGIRPEVAQAMVASGINIADLTTKASLRDAVEYALQLTAREHHSFHNEYTVPAR